MSFQTCGGGGEEREREREKKKSPLAKLQPRERSSNPMQMIAALQTTTPHFNRHKCSVPVVDSSYLGKLEPSWLRVAVPSGSAITERLFTV